ncbi:MAG: hypothetical protein KA440_08190 [Azonexus sp.]|nr:hypothetical protein [Azonexus sp.]
MNEFANPAKRLSRLIEDVVQKQDSISTAVVWAEALGLDPTLAQNDPHEVQAKLTVLRQEVDLAAKLMADTPFSKDLYEPYLSRVRSTISVGNISASWNNYKHYLEVDTRLALKYCAEILPAEPEVSTEELQTVLDSVHRLRQEIEGSALAPAVREFLLNQLAIIEKGIQDYPIRGGSAIRDAFKQGFTEFGSHCDVVKTDQDEMETSRVVKVWSSFKTAGKEIVEADRIASAYVGLIDKGQDAAKALLAFFDAGAN